MLTFPETIHQQDFPFPPPHLLYSISHRYVSPRAKPSSSPPLLHISPICISQSQTLFLTSSTPYVPPRAKVHFGKLIIRL